MVEVMRHVEISDRIWNVMVLSIIWTAVNSASAQQTPLGFISIDCGSATQHKDSVTKLTWETDGKYINSGLNGIVPNSPDSNASNYEALGTFKYFLDPQSKYCYELPLTRRNVSVLIRAMFLHGHSPLLVLPITFNVYVSATLWNSVGYNSHDDLLTPKVIEGIFYSSESIIYLCLVPDHGVPFISTLELRQLDPEGVMYSLSDRQTQALSTLVRYNLGVSDGSTVRYPDDFYDRLWSSSSYYFSSPSFSQKENANTSSSLNNVPPRVMMDAFVLQETMDLESYLLHLPLATAMSYVSAIFYCQAINNTEGVNMVLSLSRESTESFNVTDSPVMKPLQHVGLLTNSADVGVASLTASGAIVNAMEIYEEIISDYSATATDDVNLTNFLKTTFNLRHWQGDPCVPVPYDWITCADTDFSGSELITSLNLSKLHDSGRLQNSAQFIDAGALFSVNSMTIIDSYVDDSTFQFLIENFTANSALLSYLNLRYNNITTFPSIKSWSLINGEGWDPLLLLGSIDLSHNSFSGKVLSFSTFNNSEFGLTSVNKLNLSYNSFTSFPNSWGNSSYGLYNLSLLDLSHNFILSDLSFLNDLVKRNPLLEELHLSDNILTGDFPSDVYFSKQSQNLKLLNLTRNKISGSLNLTAWCQQLERTKNVSSFDGQLYSFTYNNILDIIPDANIFQPVIMEFLKSNNIHFNQSGVLLGGNPYCNDIKSLTQGYLCRKTVNEIVYNIQKKKRNVSLIVGTTLGGLAFFLLSSIIFITIWRLWRKLSITSKLLREVQQELTNRKVHPPFYSHHDLKVATRGFHEDNKLGSGAFGAVYKGTLSDGSIIAVKRLFNSDKAQVLNEFLSEVALISGIKHKHLIQLKGCCIKNEERILVYEFASNGNLAEALWGKHKTPLDWTHRLNIAAGVAHGLSYLHEELQPRIIHRDIKAANILLDDNFNAKIADFGLAKSFAEEETQALFTAVAGTRGYFAPEYALEGQLTIKADVFSFGILLLEIVTGSKCIDPTLPTDRVYIKTWAEDLEKSGMLLELLQPELRGTATEAEYYNHKDSSFMYPNQPQVPPNNVSSGDIAVEKS